MGAQIDPSGSPWEGTQHAPAKRKVFIVEDHPVFREGMAQIINSEEDLIICGQASDAEQAMPEIRRIVPDIVLVDISLPGKNGLELIKEIRSVNRAIKLLVVSMHDEALYAARVLRAGGDGYVMKEEDPEEIISAIRDVLGGHIYVSEEVMASMKPRPPEDRRAATQSAIDQLSDSELALLEMLGQGRDYAEIARKLGFDVPAVQAQCEEIKRKLKIGTNNELIRYAVCWVETGAG